MIVTPVQVVGAMVGRARRSGHSARRVLQRVSVCQGTVPTAFVVRMTAAVVVDPAMAEIPGMPQVIVTTFRVGKILETSARHRTLRLAVVPVPVMVVAAVNNMPTVRSALIIVAAAAPWSRTRIATQVVAISHLIRIAASTAVAAVSVEALVPIILTVRMGRTASIMLVPPM